MSVDDNRPMIKRMEGTYCPYCDEIMLVGTPRPPTRDHMYPRGTRPGLQNNIIIVCGPCNEEKRDLTLQQFGQKLLRAKDPRAGRVQALIKSLGLPTRRAPFPLRDGESMENDDAR